MTRIYLDHAATTTARPEVVAAMVPLLGGGFNPSSLHAEGRAAREALDAARETVARVLGALPREIVFTGCGSEADVLAVVGAARALGARGRHVVTTAIEHHAVLHAVDVLERDGWRITRLPVDPRGLVDPAAFAAALTPETTLASVIWANNEIGVLQTIAELARLAHARGVVFHTDAVQAAGWLPLSVDELGVDLLSLSSHKFYGPKGVGVLYVRSGTALEPLIVGGGQEHGLRAGTENVAGIAGLATALALAEQERPQTAPRVAALRDRLEVGILASVPDAVEVEPDQQRVRGQVGEGDRKAPREPRRTRTVDDGIAASAGSACAAGSSEPSHVAAALGLDERHRLGVIRLSLGRKTSAVEIDDVLLRLPSLIASVRTPLAV